MKIGFLLSHLGNSDVAKSFIQSANSLLENRMGVDIIGFVANQVQSVKHPAFASMNINEAFDYDGVVVATDINTAGQLTRFPGPRKRYYYLWELDWVMAGEWSYEELLELFHNPKLTIIARTPEDKRVIEQCWNCRVKAVIPDCDMEAFVELIRKDEK